MRAKKGFRFLWNLLLISMTVSTVMNSKFMARSFEIFHQIPWWMYFLNGVVTLFPASISYGLYKLHPIFGFSLFGLVRHMMGSSRNVLPQTDKEMDINANLAPTQIPIIGILYIAMFILTMPMVAYYEEKFFREGTLAWPQGILMSLLFGLAHMLIGVPLCVALALSVVASG